MEDFTREKVIAVSSPELLRYIKTVDELSTYGTLTDGALPEGWIYLGTATVHYRPEMSPEQVCTRACASIDEAKRKAAADYQKTLTDLENLRSKFLAIEN